MPERREKVAFDIDIKSEIQDNSEEVLAEFKAAITRALVRMGIQAQSYATDLIKPGTPDSTGIDGYIGGTLRQSIQAQVDPSAQKVYIGTNEEYGPYVELGTGKYAEIGGSPPWVWVDQNGDFHYTEGVRARPFLRPAINDHKQTYRNIMLDELKNG